jgi:NAD-dependent histone deacetylase SIR2
LNHDIVPDDKIIEAHGSFASQRCIDCKRTYDDAKMKRKILAKETPRCENCSGLVKPDIVFFGESVSTVVRSAFARR